MNVTEDYKGTTPKSRSLRYGGYLYEHEKLKRLYDSSYTDLEDLIHSSPAILSSHGTEPNILLVERQGDDSSTDLVCYYWDQKSEAWTVDQDLDEDFI